MKREITAGSRGIISWGADPHANLQKRQPYVGGRLERCGCWTTLSEKARRKGEEQNVRVGARSTRPWMARSAFDDAILVSSV